MVVISCIKDFQDIYIINDVFLSINILSELLSHINLENNIICLWTIDTQLTNLAEFRFKVHPLFGEARQ